MTDWEQQYLDGNTPWNKGQPSPPMEAWVKAQPPLQGRALVPGCGVGHDVAMLVQHGLDAYGLDIAPSALALAQQCYPPLANRFLLGDLFGSPDSWKVGDSISAEGSAPPMEVSGLDYVFEHTCLCALPPAWRERYEQAIHGLLKPGGLLVGIWFIEPEMDPGETGPPFGIAVAELEVLFDATRWEVVEDQVPAHGYAGRVGRERLRVLRRR